MAVKIAGPQLTAVAAGKVTRVQINVSSVGERRHNEEVRLVIKSSHQDLLAWFGWRDSYNVDDTHIVTDAGFGSFSSVLNIYAQNKLPKGTYQLVVEALSPLGRILDHMTITVDVKSAPRERKPPDDRKPPPPPPDDKDKVPPPHPDEERHYLVVDSVPRGAGVTVDGTNWGPTPAGQEVHVGTYTVTVPERFETTVRGRTVRWKFKEWEDGTTDRVRRVFVHDITRITAKYEDEGTENPMLPSPSLAGVDRRPTSMREGDLFDRGRAAGEQTVGRAGVAARRALLEMRGVKESKDRAYGPQRQPKKYPAIQAAINQGRYELNHTSEVVARGLINNHQQEMQRLRVAWTAARDDWRSERDNARNFLRRSTQRTNWLSSTVRGTSQALSHGLGAAARAPRAGTAAERANAGAIQRNLDQAYERFMRAEGALTEFYTRATMDLETEILNLLKPHAAAIARKQARRLNVDREDIPDIETELVSEAEDLARRFAAGGRGQLRGMMGIVRRFSMRSKTFGDVYLNLVTQLWEFITGPWVLGILVAAFEYMFIIIPYSGELSTLTIMGIVGAVGVFLLNFEESKYPLDWLTHMIAGAMIGAGTGLFLLALFKPFLPGFPGNLGIGGVPILGGLFGSSAFMFWVIWFFLAVFIGAFQFYQAGGYRIVFQMTILTIVFAYVALGPYNGYYKATMRPIGSVVITGFNTVKNAFMDVWLLGTNPTEWHARQQLKNVRAEKPLDFPKGIEIEELVVIPDSVPASDSERESEFAVIITFVNRGDLTAEDVSFEIECNEYAYTVDKNDKCKSGYELSGDVKPKLEPGEGGRVQFSNLHAYKPEPGRSVEFQLATMKVRVKYAYKTSSSLNVEIMNKDEINRRQFAQQSVYHTVTATSKATPAELSLNVGPQPLAAGSQNNLLAVSVLNARSDGKVVLPAGTEIKLTAPKTIISTLSCRGCESTQDDGTKLTTTCTVPKEREIKYSEFKSIFAFLCDIDTKDTAISRSDIITAEMPKFFFKVQRSKDVAITPPLGVIPAKGASKDKPGSDAANCQGDIQKHEDDYKIYKNIIDEQVAGFSFPQGVNGHAIVAAIISHEQRGSDNWDPKAVGGAGEIGFMQIIPSLHTHCGTAEDLEDPGKNIRCGTRKIADLIAKCAAPGRSLEDQIKGGLTNYNAGQGGGKCDPTFSYGVDAFAKYQAWHQCIQFAKVAYAWPVDNQYKYFTLCFGDTDPPHYSASNPHKGIDIGDGGIENGPVKAIANGKVENICEENCGNSGNNVVIKHDDGRSSAYKHLNTVTVQVNSLVTKGKQIGTVGSTGESTGPHLHLEVLENGVPVNPCNFLDCSGSKNPNKQCAVESSYTPEGKTSTQTQTFVGNVNIEAPDSANYGQKIDIKVTGLKGGWNPWVIIYDGNGDEVDKNQCWGVTSQCILQGGDRLSMPKSGPSPAVIKVIRDDNTLLAQKNVQIANA